MRGYIEQNLYMRDCCFECKYKTFPRVSDITLADFWGVGKSDDKLDEDKGTSLILINSDKGKEIFNDISSSVFCQQSNLEFAKMGNMCIDKCPPKNQNIEKFLNMLDKESFDVCFKKFIPRKRKQYFKKAVQCIKALWKG
jgi:hypothetical protein